MVATMTESSRANVARTVAAVGLLLAINLSIVFWVLIHLLVKVNPGESFAPQEIWFPFAVALMGLMAVDAVLLSVFPKTRMIGAGFAIGLVVSLAGLGLVLLQVAGATS